MWCGVVWCGVVWCGVVWVWCGARFFNLVKARTAIGVVARNFMPLLEELLAFHPGLTFLEGTPEFQVRACAPFPSCGSPLRPCGPWTRACGAFVCGGFARSMYPAPAFVLSLLSSLLLQLL